VFVLIATHNRHGGSAAELVFGESTDVIIMRRKSRKLSEEVITVDTRQLDELVERAAATMEPDDAELVRRVFESYAYLHDVIADKDTSLKRLRKLIFGSSSEKTKDVVGDDTSCSNQDTSPPEVVDELSDNADASDDSSQPDPNSKTRAQRRGHGRISASHYQGAAQVDVQHDQLSEGDPCPDCNGGKLYEKTPKVIVRIVGQPPLGATVYRLQKLRCHLCGKLFTAREPTEATGKKYDETAATMIGLLRYGAGLPFNRLARLQRSFEIPLPASTQWDVVYAITPQLAPAYEALIQVAAQGDVLHNDDTTIKILELMKENAALESDSDARTGIFTSGVVATSDAHRVALFFSGRQHAGENLSDVLQHRADELRAPIQMCDGLSRNLPQELETILANCIAHARRKFIDIYDRFEDECRYVLESFRVVYQNDKIAHKKKMSPEQRLRHHRIKSEQTMNRLHRWLKRQFDEKLVEPNSALGEAINYLLKRWDALTLFLREPGAPLDNNIAENALKRAIIHRKNSLFYRTQRGAKVGDLLMSLIYTCELNGANAFDYLNALQRNADAVAAQPDQWLPWNFSQAKDKQHVAA
jgi:transposase